jgi:hypothetical protein
MISVSAVVFYFFVVAAVKKRSGVKSFNGERAKDLFEDIFQESYCWGPWA